jgi:ribose 5-phosphate isomerase B
MTEPSLAVGASTDVVAVASDHAGVGLKSVLAEELRALGREVRDLGAHGPESVDYPDYGAAMARAIMSGEARLGVIVCGTGIGIGIAANRFAGVRAAVCHDSTSARLARQHNDANVLALGARLIGEETARDCLRTFLATEFEGGRHALRVDKLTQLGRASD